MPKESDKDLPSENVEIATNIQRRDGWALLMIEQDTQEERERWMILKILVPGGSELLQNMKWTEQNNSYEP